MLSAHCTPGAPHSSSPPTTVTANASICTRDLRSEHPHGAHAGVPTPTCHSEVTQPGLLTRTAAAAGTQHRLISSAPPHGCRVLQDPRPPFATTFPTLPQQHRPAPAPPAGRVCSDHRALASAAATITIPPLAQTMVPPKPQLTFPLNTPTMPLTRSCTGPHASVSNALMNLNGNCLNFSSLCSILRHQEDTLPNPVPAAFADQTGSALCSQTKQSNQDEKGSGQSDPPLLS